MWFEVLPPFFIMVGAFSFAHFTPGLVNLVVKKNAYLRDLTGDANKMQYLRDIRLGGDPYTVKGLESIPDE